MKPTIHSLQNPLVKQFRVLRDAAGRREQGMFLIDGWIENQRAATAKIRFQHVCFRVDSPHANAIAAQFPADLLQPIADNVMEKISYGNRCEEVIGVAMTPSLDLGQLRPSTPELVLILDRCEKPGNLGACARTAMATGASALILSDPICDLFNPNAIRASRGCLFGLPVAAGSSAQVIQWCQARSVQVLAARVDGHDGLWNLDLRSPAAVVFGNEAQGLGEPWRQSRAFQIPMRPGTDSLNVATSAAVTLYEAMRQRGG